MRRTERSARIETAVGAPIVVEGRLWGVVSAGWNPDESPPADTEQRMAQFAQLLDTAIANADSRDQLMASRARLVTAATTRGVAWCATCTTARSSGSCT